MKHEIFCWRILSELETGMDREAAATISVLSNSGIAVAMHHLRDKISSLHEFVWSKKGSGDSKSQSVPSTYSNKFSGPNYNLFKKVLALFQSASIFYSKQSSEKFAGTLWFNPRLLDSISHKLSNESLKWNSSHLHIFLAILNGYFVK